MDGNSNQDASRVDERGQVPYPRWVIAGVFVLLLAIAGLSFWQLKNRLVISLPQLGEGDTVQTVASNLLEAQDEQLKQQDSDQDSLSDYDELRVYGTSPFIADTDSDRVSDSAEVRLGTDPVCPAGKTCFGGSQSSSTATDTSDNPFFSPEFTDVLNDPDQLRQLLIAGGADPAVVNKLDDQTIQILGQEAYKSATQVTPEKIEILKQLTPEQIRGLLKSSGMNEAEIAAFSDEELLEIYHGALLQAEAGIAPTPSSSQP